HLCAKRNKCAKLCDRISRRSEYIQRPALTLGVTVQPSVLESLAKKPELRGRGLLSRFLYALPVSLVGQHQADPPALPSEARDLYRANIRALLELPSAVGAGLGHQPHLLTLTPDAQQ